jgi:hypothetical protein
VESKLLSGHVRPTGWCASGAGGPGRQISGKARGQSQMESQARLGPRHIDTLASALWNTRGQHWGYPQYPQASTPSPRAPLPSYCHQ